MKKIVLMLSAIFLIVSHAKGGESNFHAQQARFNEEPIIKRLYTHDVWGKEITTDNPYKYKNFIKMAANVHLCGSFSVNIPDNYPNKYVRLISTYVSPAGRWTSESKSTLTPIGETTLYKGQEKSFSYNDASDWGIQQFGLHYRIYCLTQNPQTKQWEPVDCDKVVYVTSKKHNVGCVVGPLGPEANSGELHMDQNDPYIIRK